MIDFATAIKRENLELLLADACHTSIALAPELTLRYGGAAVTPAMRDELLAKVKAGDYVELEIDVHAFDQETGKRNRKNVRFRDGAIQALGRSGAGKPVLRDHEQGDSLAVAGKITSSKGEKVEEGKYSIDQVWNVTAPWMVELALRNLLSFVSIGWSATGPVMCSACDAPVFSQCYHCPGDMLSEQVGDDGKTRKVRDRKGSIVVEWVYTSAELTETSITPVPAVTSARIESIRAALSAHGGGISPPAEEGNNMDPKLLALLGLAATAGVSEVLSAVESLVADRAELKLATSELKIANGELETLRGEKRKTEADQFIADALSSGKIAKGDEAQWRDLFELSAERARKRMSERVDGSATPVGQKRHSAENHTEDKAAATGGDAIAETHKILKANGVDPKAAAHYASRFGVTGDPMKAIAKHCAGQEVE